MFIKLSATNITITGTTCLNKYTMRVGSVKVPFTNEIFISMTFDTLKATINASRLIKDLNTLSEFIKNMLIKNIYINLRYNIVEYSDEYILCKPIYNTCTIIEKIAEQMNNDFRTLSIKLDVMLTNEQIKEVQGIINKRKISVYDKANYKV